MNRTDRKMTDRERRLAEENHNLIYSFLAGHNLSLNDGADWYGAAAAALCRAAMVYDPSRGESFATIAYACMMNAVRAVVRAESMSAEADTSLDENVPGTEFSVWGDVIADPSDFTDRVCEKDLVERTLDTMSGRDRRLISRIIRDGWSQAEVALASGLSKANVNRIYKIFMGRLADLAAA